MAEVIGSVSAVVALVEFSGKILSLGYGYLSKVARAPAEVRLLLSEVANLNVLLGRLQTFAEDGFDPSASTVLQSLAQLGIFKTCEKLLGSVYTIIDTCQRLDGQDVKNFGKRLLWPFKERETKDTMQRLGCLRDTLTAALAADSAAALSRLEDAARKIDLNVDAVKEAVHEQLDDSKRQQLMDWACPDDTGPEESYEAALRQKQPSTGRWFLESDIFKKWLGTKNTLLWLHGIPGCGKTVLSATIVEHLRFKYRAPAYGLAYFYCDHRNSKQQTVGYFLMTVVRQLVQQHGECLKDIEMLFDTKKQDVSRKLSTGEYLRLIKTMSLHFKQVIVLIDALDESVEEETFINAFEELLFTSQGDTTIQIILTSRNDLNIERLVLPLTTWILSLKDAMVQDVGTYIAAEIEDRVRSRRLKFRDPSLGNQILESLVRQADGLFLQAKIQLEYISTMGTDRAIKAALTSLPKGLDDTYERILQQIISKTPEKVEEVKTILQWLVESVAPMTLHELAEAISIEPNDTELDPDGIATDPEDLVAMCRSLVVLDRSIDPPIARLAHFSVEEYLLSDHIAHSSVACFHIDPSIVDLKIAQTCIQYLSFQDFAKAAVTEDTCGYQELDERVKQYALLRYAARYWPEHLKFSGVTAEDHNRHIVGRLQWFLQPGCSGDQYLSWLQIYHLHCSTDEDCSRQPPFYHAVVFGLKHVFNLLLPQVENINAHFVGGWTPLTAAATARQTEMVKTILRAGAQPDIPVLRGSQKWRTALHLAAEQGLEEIAQVLLDAGASPHARSVSLATPLYRAARSGSIPILKMLHDRGADVNASTYDYWTPIFEAIHNGFTDVVDLLLQWGAAPDTANIDGDTPLSLAKLFKQDEMVRLLKKAINSRSTVNEEALPSNSMESKGRSRSPMFRLRRTKIATAKKETAEGVRREENAIAESQTKMEGELGEVGETKGRLGEVGETQDLEVESVD
ncbi:MAG: hypothetical protein FRX48_07121 [Lasallia pustulata]|uniref:Uncharacterized protein n=1 Tax=Lasallia pustulata TaxID=136370 RepID=A0A5M8PIG8_9LECA|nr:MAG: hypothetical protein FRX48_07121 [Lasallia pustulata]